MRPIKFREWETERKTMSYGKREDFDDSVSFRFAHSEGGKRILMQYTGLKDKNGVEIYEGDIITGVNCFNERWTGEIKYLSPYFALLGTKSHMIMDDLQKIKVIGNIYENKNLLEEIK